MDDIWDCIVIGGGGAGLSAALVLGRARRRTLLLDAGGQSNRPAAGIGGLLGHDGRPPDDFYVLAREELAGYPTVELRAVAATGATHAADGFELTLDDATEVRGRTVLLATGSDYARTELPGAAERWGGSVFHCPFCHGWEVREQPLGVLGASPADVERALLLRAWSDDVTLLTDGAEQLDAGASARLDAAGVTVDQRPVAALRGPGAELEAVVFENGSERRCAGLLVGVALHGRCAIGEALGASILERPPLVAAALVVDPASQTTVPGLFAAGDVTGEMPSVANAVAAGSRAAAAVVRELMCGGRA